MLLCSDHSKLDSLQQNVFPRLKDHPENSETNIANRYRTLSQTVTRGFEDDECIHPRAASVASTVGTLPRTTIDEKSSSVNDTAGDVKVING